MFSSHGIRAAPERYGHEKQLKLDPRRAASAKVLWADVFDSRYPRRAAPAGGRPAGGSRDSDVCPLRLAVGNRPTAP